MKTCIYCGAELPDTANLCPECGKVQTEAVRETMPRPWRRKLLTVLAALLALALCFLGVRLYHAPKTYIAEGGEIEYTDGGSRYKLFVSWKSAGATQNAGTVEKTDRIAELDQGLAPAQLYAFDMERGVNDPGEFEKKLSSVRLEAVPDGSSEPVEIIGPYQSGDFPYSVRMADIGYTAFSSSNDLVWTLSMKNGDTVVLRQHLTVEKQKTAVYTADEWPMNSMEELQALLQHIEENESPDTVVTVHLPAVTYEGGLHFDTRSYHLVGSTRGEARTTFTRGTTVSLRKPQIAEFENICFRGSGTGTGLSASEGVILTDCLFSGWEVGAEARDGSWIAAFGTTFEENGIGLQFNSANSSMVYPNYQLDHFLNNGIGISLLRVPNTVEIKFEECVFSGNGTDIENPAGHPVNTESSQLTG